MEPSGAMALQRPQLRADAGTEALGAGYGWPAMAARRWAACHSAVGGGQSVAARGMHANRPCGSDGADLR